MISILENGSRRKTKGWVWGIVTWTIFKYCDGSRNRMSDSQA
jgi:hypothetical protein